MRACSPRLWISATISSYNGCQTRTRGLKDGRHDFNLREERTPRRICCMHTRVEWYNHACCDRSPKAMFLKVEYKFIFIRMGPIRALRGCVEKAGTG